MDYWIRSEVVYRPTFDLSELLAFGLGIERVIFATEPVRLASGFAIIAIVVILSRIVFNTEEAPAAVEADIYMELLLAVELFDASTVDPDDITDTFYLRTVFYAFGIEHAIDALKAFPRFTAFCWMRDVYYFDRADVFVLGLVGLGGIHDDAVNVYLILVLFKLG